MFPATIKIENLLAVSGGYSLDGIQKYNDLYRGGQDFKSRIDRYLLKRKIEESTLGTSRQYEERKKRAWYTPHVAGLVDWIVAAVFQSPPVVVSGEEYWAGLNANADGRGIDISALCRVLLLETLLQGRAYVALDFPDAVEQTSFALQKKTGALDAKLSVLTAAEVDDWDETFIRTHTVSFERENPYTPPNVEVHRWTISTADSVAIYKARVKIGEHLDKAGEAILDSEQIHSLGVIPIFKVNIPDGMWLMNRVSEIVLAIFHRESARTWYLDSGAYQVPVLKSPRKFSDTVLPDEAFMHLNPELQEEFGFRGPDSTISDALDKDCERLIENLFRSVQAMTLAAPMKDDHGRQSGVAKFRDMMSLATLLGAYASALRDCLEQAVQTIAKARGETAPQIYGLDKFDIQSKDYTVQLAKDFLALPNVPKSAKEWVIRSASMAVADDAPPEVLQQISDEAKAEISGEQEADKAAPLDINGAVAEGLTNLMRANILTHEEVRRRLGFEPNEELMRKSVTFADNQISNTGEK